MLKLYNVYFYELEIFFLVCYLKYLGGGYIIIYLFYRIINLLFCLCFECNLLLVILFIIILEKIIKLIFFILFIIIR